VTKDVPPYCIVAGNPAVIIKQRFEQATIDRLLQLSWWDWPLGKITAALTAITRGDIQALGVFHAEK
jgi:virginiamycin A acetyltransferase